MLCNDLEDEYHVICICPRYAAIRKQFIKPYYIIKPSMYKFNQLLQTENKKEMQMLAVCTKQIFTLHKETIIPVIRV